MKIKDLIDNSFIKKYDRQKLITISVFQLLAASFVSAGIVINNINSIESKTNISIIETQFNGKHIKQNKELKYKYELQIKTFTATAYDLSYECCGKLPTDDGYGITYSGTRAQKKRTIAVDPNIIPIGSKVFIKFPVKYNYMNGWYYAEDTGSMIQGYRIDVFFGDSAFEEALDFGIREVSVLIIDKIKSH